LISLKHGVVTLYMATQYVVQQSNVTHDTPSQTTSNSTLLITISNNIIYSW